MRRYVIKRGKKYLNQKERGYTHSPSRTHVYFSKTTAQWAVLSDKEKVVPVEVTIEEITE